MYAATKVVSVSKIKSITVAIPCILPKIRLFYTQKQLKTSYIVAKNKVIV